MNNTLFYSFLKMFTYTTSSTSYANNDAPCHNIIAKQINPIKPRQLIFKT